MKISPLAAIDPKAQIAPDVEIGPFCVVGPDVVIGPGCRLFSHVTLMNHVTLGRGNLLYPGVVLGGPPQDLKFKGSPTRVEVGDNNSFREHVTIHIGTEKGGGVTRVGNSNLLMVNVHLGHDAQVGSNNIFSNNCMIAGHVVIHDNVTMAGGVGIHHRVTVGEFSFLGGYSRIHHDAPPFVKVDGADQVRGLNSVGLRRAGFGEDDIEALEEACRTLFYRERPFSEVLAEFNTLNGVNRHVRRLVDFLRQRDEGRHGRSQEARKK